MLHDKNKSKFIQNFNDNKPLRLSKTYCDFTYVTTIQKINMTFL